MAINKISNVRIEKRARRFFVPLKRNCRGEYCKQNGNEISLFHHNMERSEKLAILGPSAIYPVLNLLEKMHHSKRLPKPAMLDGSPVFHLISTIEPYISPMHESQKRLLGKMLFWKEIIQEDDRSTRHDLMNMLGKVGDGASIGTLNIFLLRLNKLYPQYKEFDSSDVKDTQETIRERLARSRLSNLR